MSSIQVLNPEPIHSLPLSHYVKQISGKDVAFARPNGIYFTEAKEGEAIFSYFVNGHWFPVKKFNFLSRQLMKMVTIEVVDEDDLSESVRKRVKNTMNYCSGYWTDCNPRYLLFDGRCAGYILDDNWGWNGDNGPTFWFIDTERIFEEETNKDMKEEEIRMFVLSNEYTVTDLVTDDVCKQIGDILLIKE